jgi:hypothetical protein
VGENGKERGGKGNKLDKERSRSSPCIRSMRKENVSLTRLRDREYLPSDERQYRDRLDFFLSGAA